ncbi:hypothetical protein [Flavicella sediminum]|uniref:hypothetical protein n=1 Tax=Flavicella sediminum TaxID=2585141 RepID=UPI00111D98F0|nr:hypothetical protein [Flavicella sediminum]
MRILSYICRVKNGIKILSIVFMTIVYCFAIGMVNTEISDSSASKKSSSSEEKVATVLTNKILCELAEVDSSVNSSNNLPVPNFKNPFSGFYTFGEKKSSQFIENRYTQYVNSWSFFLIHNWKKTILFPFHNFW